MLKLKFADNVFLDSASSYEWEALNESVFLENVFVALEREMGAQFAEYAFFIFSAHDTRILPNSVGLKQENKILIFISDESSSVPIHLAEHYFAIFKAYTPFEVYNSNIFSFNLGYVGQVPRFDPVAVNDRSVDIFFCGNLHPNRFVLYEALHPVFKYLPLAALRGWLFLLRHAACTSWIRKDFSVKKAETGSTYIVFTDGFKKGLSQDRYGELLADSKIVLCPKGFTSGETFRHIEAIRAGAIVVTEQLPDIHFYRGAPFVVVSNWKNGLRKARNLLSDPCALQQMQKESIAWYESKCSEAATAKYMKSKIVDLHGQAQISG